MSTNSALDRLRSRQRENQAQRVKNLPRTHASQSHELNDEYMERFEEGLRILGGATHAQAPGYAQQRAPRSTPDPTQLRPAASSRQRSAAHKLGRGAPSGVPSAASSRHAGSPTSRTGPGAPAAQEASLRAMSPRPLSQGWASGPVDERGTLLDLSDRPILCGDTDWNQGLSVVGCSDHALYVVDLKSRRQKRTLHTKTGGHAEWVTTTAWLPDGRVVSGAMDSKICLWAAGSVACRDLTGHSGPVSVVKRAGAHGWAASASYDKTVRLWDCGGRRAGGVCAQTLLGHRAPVLCMDVDTTGSRIASGDRGGSVLMWDTATGALSGREDGLHAGHTTALLMGGGDGNEVLSGGQDGDVCMLDARVGRGPVARRRVHANEKGRGAVGCLEAVGGDFGSYIVTAGADGTAMVLDTREGLAEIVRFQLTDFPYSLCVVGTTALVGCGDGSLHVIDVAAGQRRYALGANQAAVRYMAASEGTLIAAGDDGNVLVYEFA